MTLTAILAIAARPFIGAVIGYITNDIAIRMLFRPHTAKYILGIHIPFTPGIIPKEKGRIAAAIGTAISENLMNKEVVEKALLSPEMIAKIGDAIDAFLDNQRGNTATLREFILENITDEQFEELRASLLSEAKTQIGERLAASALGERIAAVATDHVIEKMRGEGGLRSAIFAAGPEVFAKMLATPLQKLLARNIDEILQRNAPQIVGEMIDTQSEQLLATPMTTLLQGKEEQIAKAKSTVVGLYRSVITTRLPRILEAVNISRIIEERINEMDVEESERVILQVMKRELRALVWLGALLGFIMGCVNLLF